MFNSFLGLLFKALPAGEVHAHGGGGGNGGGLGCGGVGVWACGGMRVCAR